MHGMASNSQVLQGLVFHLDAFRARAEALAGDLRTSREAAVRRELLPMLNQVDELTTGLQNMVRFGAQRSDGEAALATARALLSTMVLLEDAIDRAYRSGRREDIHGSEQRMMAVALVADAGSAVRELTTLVDRLA